MHLGTMRGAAEGFDSMQKPEHRVVHKMRSGGSISKGKDAEEGEYNEVTALAVAHRIMAAMLRREALKPDSPEGNECGPDSNPKPRTTGDSQDGAGERGSPTDGSLGSACQRWNLEKGLPLLRQALHSVDREIQETESCTSEEGGPQPHFSSAYMPPRSHPLDTPYPTNSTPSARTTDKIMASERPKLSSLLNDHLPRGRPEDGMWYIAVPLSSRPETLPQGAEQDDGGLPDASRWVDWEFLSQVAHGADPLQKIVDLGSKGTRGVDVSSSVSNFVSSEASTNAASVNKGYSTPDGINGALFSALEDRLLFRSTGDFRQQFIYHPVAPTTQAASPIGPSMTMNQIGMQKPCQSDTAPSSPRILPGHCPQHPIGRVPQGAPTIPVIRLSRAGIKTDLLQRGRGAESDEGKDAGENDGQRGTCLIPPPSSSASSVRIQPHDLMVHPMPLSRWIALNQLPSLVHRLETMVSAHEFREQVLMVPKE